MVDLKFTQLLHSFCLIKIRTYTRGYIVFIWWKLVNFCCQLLVHQKKKKHICCIKFVSFQYIFISYWLWMSIVYMNSVYIYMYVYVFSFYILWIGTGTCLRITPSIVCLLPTWLCWEVYQIWCCKSMSVLLFQTLKALKDVEGNTIGFVLQQVRRGNSKH